MTKKSDAPKSNVSGPTPIIDTPHAPILFFDVAPNYGNNGQVVNVTIGAFRNILQPDNTIKADVVVTGYLRCSVVAAGYLRDALDGALKMLERPEGQAH